MAENLKVRRYCQDCGEFKYENQTDVIFDPEFVPSGCETHTLEECVIERREVI